MVVQIETNMRQKEIMIESQTIRLGLGGDGSNTPQAEAEEAEKQLRNFKTSRSPRSYLTNMDTRASALDVQHHSREINEHTLQHASRESKL